MMNVTKLVGIACAFFYFSCWFVNQPTKLLWYIGVALPWLSLFLTILAQLIYKKDKYDNYTIWGHVYFISTGIFVAAVSLMKGSLLSEIPYLATCISFIAYFSLEFANKKGKP